ncbi:MAG: hypothetical protein EPN86_05470 [Nanoarchaeota archaeon]|nr:MAG: hypothetical protein EPN86_05470 [Nanoarchaeota archaeon]
MSINVVVDGEYREVDNFLALPRRTVQYNRNEAQLDMQIEAGIQPKGKVVYELDASNVYGLSPFRRGYYFEPGKTAPEVYRITHLDTDIFGTEVRAGTNEYWRIMKWLGIGNSTRNLLNGNSSALLPPEYLAIAPLFAPQP